MKTILLNGSPRAGWNTAQLLHAAQEGAESVGAQTEYLNLYDLNYTGCRGCLACKRAGGERCRCYWKDDLSPLLSRIFEAGALILGVPNYLGDITSQVHALLERLRFCCLSYDDYSNYFTGRVNVGVILTMNAPLSMYEAHYRDVFEARLNLSRTLNGSVEFLPACDTLQVSDYSRYSMAGFDEARKRAVRETQFPLDMRRAFDLGARLSAAKG